MLTANLIVVTSLALGAADAGPAEEVTAAVQALEAAFNKGDADAVKALMTADHFSLTSYAKFAGVEELLKALPDYKIADRQLSKVEVRPVTADVALAYYRSVIKGTYKGAELPRQVRIIAVWVKKDGKWKEASYQETPNPSAAKK